MLHTFQIAGWLDIEKAQWYQATQDRVATAWSSLRKGPGSH